MERNIETRPFREDDREPVLAITNRDLPPHRRESVASWQSYEAARITDAVSLRLVTGDPAVAFMEIIDLNTTPRKLSDVCDLDVFVAQEHRRRGLGAALYEQALEFARARGAKRIVSEFFAWTPDEPAIAFLERRGFSELEREQAAYLDLADFHPALFEAALERVKNAGVRIVTYAEAGDTEENQQRLYALNAAIHHAVPRRDNQPFILPAWDEWWRRLSRRPEFSPHRLRLAEADGQWVGMTNVARHQASTMAMQWITGVLPAYQGRGIATALKVEAYAAAKAHGITVITTENDSENGPMLAINKKFGFRPDAPLLTYNKVL
jgi:GNAT superfamily N-acetyltransferase